MGFARLRFCPDKYRTTLDVYFYRFHARRVPFQTGPILFYIQDRSEIYILHDCGTDLEDVNIFLQPSCRAEKEEYDLPGIYTEA